MLKLNPLSTIFSASRSSPAPMPWGSVRFLSSKSLSVRNLPRATSPLEIRQLFETKLLVTGIRMPVDKMGKCRGFAFVDVTDEKGSIEVSELSELKIRGATLLVQESVSELRLKDIHKVY